MSIPRNTVFWFLILVILGGAFYLINQKAEESKQAEESALRMFPFSQDDVVEFWIWKAGEETLRLEKEQDEWFLKEPLKVKGDEKAIADMLKNITTARKDGVLFEKAEPAKLKELGLDNPKHKMGIKTASIQMEISFGFKGPTHNVAYAILKGDSRVYRLHSDIASEARKTLYDLRDKIILGFEPMKVIKIEIERPGKRMVIEQSLQGKWDIKKPETGPASLERVLETLYRVKESKIKAFIEGETQALSSYGLKPTKVKLTFIEKDKDRSKEHFLEIGSKDRSRRGYFAKTNGGKGVFILEEGLVNHLLQDAGYWGE